MTGPVSRLAGWRAGDRAAGQRLFARYYEPVARFFINKVGDKSPDLIQRTFLACVEGMPRFRGEGSFRSYLFAVAYRRLCRHYRDQEGNRLDLDSVSAVALDPSLSGLVVEREELRLFLAGLRDIPLDLQVVLELHYWEDCSVAEIAVALDIPQGTVKSRLRRGREQLCATVERLAALPDGDNWCECYNPIDCIKLVLLGPCSEELCDGGACYCD
ncbi:RNA polymerase sigma factor [Enhygromyxa salina]|uniref:ECF RNA polymerase sigma-E factor n=1 Tax=Enhygromyxa salina TaxID=215803 RepID=A0A2S9Y2I1_9BACT|nr:sigma-70 family RNA polymerase sigma factor [Enhygromyxa salina]PRP99327.1 ECF RNA polymerase sigma-E factor [Enhygromyxa salina]